ncbi:MAG: DUF4142 domain-containing protein [Proteobacteria bacterium]|nr:DUF4142 domain-containing protein [Pseudomonadota bacterium]
MLNTQSYLKVLLISALSLSSFWGLADAHNGEKHESDSLTDANIAAIVVGANKIDISAGHIAIEYSDNKEVKKFANLMIVDHQSVLDAAVELVTRLGVEPENNDLVFSLAEQSQQHEAKLKTLSGKAFDKAYIDHEVAYHQAVIGVIEQQLIPSAKNAELKSLLESVLPAFKAHLDHSLMIQQKLS